MLNISVICPLLNEERNVDGLITSLLEQTMLPQEIILVDGGSTDGTVELIKAWISKGAPIKLLIAPRPNISQQRNIAIRNAQGEIIACTNADCVLTREWLEALIAPMLADASIEVVSGVYFGRGEKLLQRLLSSILEEKFAKIARVTILPQANSMAFRRYCWERVGGFPEWTHRAEDIYFDLELRKAGFKFVLAPKAVAYWEQRATLRHLFQQYYHYASAESRMGISSADFRYMISFIRYTFRAGSRLTLTTRNPTYAIYAPLVALSIFWGHSVGRLAGKIGRIGAKRPVGSVPTVSPTQARGLRVLQITPYFWPGFRGQEQTVGFLSQELSRLGHSVDVITINTEKAKKVEILWDKVHVNRYAPIMGYRRWKLSPGLIARMSVARGYDLVHIHLPFPVGLETAIFWAKSLGIPLVATLHSEPAPSGSLTGRVIAGYSWFTRNLSLRFVDRLIVFSPSWAEVLEMLASVRAKIKVIKPAVDTQRFSPNSDSSSLRRLYGFGPDDRVVLFVGAIHYWERRKGVHHLIKAMALVKGTLPTARLVIAGMGRLQSELQEQTEDLGLGDNVFFAGTIRGEQVPLHYALCDLMVLPSEYEAFGYVVLEAMASGKPVVVCDVPGVKENVCHGLTGLVVPPRSPEALAQAILSLLKDEELRRQMGERGRQEMLKRTWEDVARETVEVYREVLES